MSKQNGDGNEDLKGYYVIKFEKFIDLMTEIEHKYQISADLLHNKIIATTPQYWDDTDIPALIEFLANVQDIRNFLENKINNPPDEEVKLAAKYDIKDVLLKDVELAKMNTLLLAEEQLEADLAIDYKISIVTH